MLGHIIDAILHAFTAEAARHADPNPAVAKRLRRAKVLFWMGGLVVAVGVGIGVGLYREQLAGEASAGWPTVPGRVESSYVVEIPTRATSYHAAVRFGYTVNGQYYSNDRLSYKFKPSGREGCAAVVSQYPAGRSVTVYYDPDDPSRSVLEPGLGDDSNLLMALLYLLFPGLGLAVIGLGWRMRRKALRELNPPAPAAQQPVPIDDNPYRRG